MAEQAVAKLIITRNGQVLQEVVLAEGRMTIGRHPASDVVIAHRAVSAQHAAITLQPGGHAFIEDLNSTNGTWVDGQRVARRPLEHGERVTIAKFEVEFVLTFAAPAAPLLPAGIEVTSGPNAGKRLMLTKPVSTLGRPGVQVVAITRQSDGFYLKQVEGASAPLLNGAPLGTLPVRLAQDDVIDVAGTTMQFFVQASV